MSTSSLEGYQQRLTSRTMRFVERQLDVPERSGEFALNTEVWIREILADFQDVIAHVALTDTEDEPHLARALFVLAAVIRVELDKAGNVVAKEIFDTLGRSLQFDKESINVALLLQYCLSMAHDRYDHEAFLMLYRKAVMEAKFKAVETERRFEAKHSDD